MIFSPKDTFWKIRTILSSEFSFLEYFGLFSQNGKFFENLEPIFLFGVTQTGGFDSNPPVPLPPKTRTTRNEIHYRQSLPT